MGLPVSEAQEVCTKEISWGPGYGGLEFQSKVSGMKAMAQPLRASV